MSDKPGTLRIIDTNLGTLQWELPAFVAQKLSGLDVEKQIILTRSMEETITRLINVLLICTGCNDQAKVEADLREIRESVVGVAIRRLLDDRLITEAGALTPEALAL